MPERVRVIDSQRMQGRKEIALPSLRPSLKKLGLAIDRTGWTDESEQLTVGLEVSFDGGKTWSVWCSVTASGGERRTPQGEIATETYVNHVPPPEGAMVRAFSRSGEKAVARTVRLREIT